MLTVDEAQTRILAHLRPQPAEVVPLAEALGRVLATSITAPVAIPPWDNSAMDGYAVRAEDTAGASEQSPVGLDVLEVIGAGSVATRSVGPGQCAAIMTGAPMPPGADGVVVVEDTDGATEGPVSIRCASHPGKHVRREGEAVRIGDTVAEAGDVLGSGALGLLASMGLPEIAVARRPRLVVLSTGDEVVPPGRPLGPGQIYSSNNVALAAAIREAGGIAIDRGNVRDDPDAIAAALRDAAGEADAVVTTGGVSMGHFDHVKDVMGTVGTGVDFWKVRMKPGKPLAFGRLGDVPLFGLPGNPVSCLVNFAEFVRPWLRASLGDRTPFLPVVDAVAAEDFHDRPGRARFLRVALAWEEGGLVARSTGTQSSGAVVSMARADGLLIVPHDQQAPLAGALVRVQLLHSRFLHRADAGTLV